MKNLSIGMKMIIIGLLLVAVTYVLEGIAPDMNIVINYVITAIGALLILLGFIKDRKGNKNK